MWLRCKKLTFVIAKFQSDVDVKFRDKERLTRLINAGLQPSN
jgi:hypothetical protein